MSPSGKLLAVAGNLGLQLFHFNGAAPIRYTQWLWKTLSFVSIGTITTISTP